MNLSIQQPTTLIKIKNLHTVSKKEIEEDPKQQEGIDFYKLDFNGKKEQCLSNMSDSGFFDGNVTMEEYSSVSCEKNDESTKEYECIKTDECTKTDECIKDDLFIQSSQDLCPFGDSRSGGKKVRLLSETRKRTQTLLQRLNLNFVIDNLKFDLRVKEYSIIQDYILVYFFCKTDSLSFYRQYFKYLDLSFISNCDWFTSSFAFPSELNSENNKDETQLPFAHFEDEIEEEIYSRKRFEEKIAFYNQLKSSFNKANLKAMLNDLENRKTDFVFLNTKELAVGSKSNKIMQDAIKLMSGDEISRIYEKLEYDIVPISATKHGAYTIQTLLNYSTNNSHKKVISKYFAKEGEYLLSHEIGNYTFQKIIAFDNKLVCDFFMSNFQDVVKSELGLKVFKRCIENLDEYKDKILNKINEYKEIDMNVFTQLKQIMKNL